MNKLKKHPGFFYSTIILLLMTFKLAAGESGRDILYGINTELAMHDGGGHNYIHELNTRYYLYNICKNDIEGYGKKLFGRDSRRPSLREDLNRAMISRPSLGESDMAFEFLTGKVPENYNREEVSFFFYSNIDLNSREPFDVKINNKSILTFIADEDGTLTVLNNPGNGKAEFILIERDENKNGIGAFRLTVPTTSIVKGQQAKINIQSHKRESNSWFMIFKADDVIKRLNISVKNDASFGIKQKEGFLYIDAPAHFANKTVYIISDGQTSKKSVFKIQGELAKAKIKINAPKRNFKIVYGEDSIEIVFKDGSGVSTKTDIIGEYFHFHNTQYKKGWSASISKLYRPGFYNALDDFFDKKHVDGTVSIINSSHQDIAWMDRPEVCIILRDTMLLTPVINDAFIRDDYGFDIEDGLMLREYLERHPDAQQKITTLLNKNLIGVGASYNCPYEDMYDSEDLVRQFYLGKKWVKKTFGGYNSKVYWNVDVPGKTMQFPQILKKAGVDYMVISRHAKGMFNWESPDGSTVFTYSPGQYEDDYRNLSKDLRNNIEYGAEQVAYWNQYFPNNKTATPLLSSADMLPAIDYYDFIKAWNGLESIKGEDVKNKQVYLPEMGLMTSDEFMPLAQKNATKIETIRGERPNVWVYIHGPAHHEALTASREASKILPAAEKFLSVANILDPKRMVYPFEELDKAWQAKIFPDHGWGGHHGDITDGLFKEKLVESRAMGNNLLNKGTGFIANRIKTNEKNGIPVVLFNSLSWDRTDPVKVSINLEKGNAKSVQVFTSDKQKVASQITNAKYFNDGSIKSVDVVFIAKKIPSIGYKTYYVAPSTQLPVKTNRMASPLNYENDAYKITFEKGGIGQIYDKELKRNLLKTDNLKGAEVFTLYSNGNGAGEFSDIQQPLMQDFDKVSSHNPDWAVVENGDIYTTYRIKQDILHATVQQDVTVYHELKRVLFETQLLNWDGTLYREFRTAFPIAIENAQVTYEVPFGAVKVGQDEIQTAGYRYTALCKDVHPRAIMDWFSASDKDMTVTLSSSVAAIDWIDPTSDSKETILQHVLLASRTSCHGQGNEYSQEGSHSYHNILTSGKTGDINSTRIAEQQNDPIHIILYPDKSNYASLPESASFFGLNNENIIISTIKKAEDSKDLVIRMYDTEGKDTSTKLNSFFKVGNYKHMNIIEENPKPVPSFEISKFGIETFGFKVKQ